MPMRFFHLLILFFSYLIIQKQLLCYSNQEPLDFETAVYRVLNHSLPLTIAQSEVFSTQAHKRQTTFYPNPEFEYEVEQFGGTKEWRGWEAREEKWELTQLVELGGKRGIRTKAALYQYYATLVGYEVSKWEILNKLSKVFVRLAAAQELLTLAYRQKQTAEEELSIVTEKVKEGKVSPIQQSKALVAYSKAELNIEKAQVEVEVAKQRLALLWGSACPDFQEVCYPFFAVHPPLALDGHLEDLCNQPEIVRALYEHVVANQNWRLEKANQVPDVTLKIGYQYEHDTGNGGFIAGFQIPLPLFDQNQGNIGRAYFNMLKAGDQGKQLWLILESKLAISYRKLSQAYHEIIRLKDHILTAANASFQLAIEGYKEGKFEYLDVLDAQRTLFEVQERYIQALVNYHEYKADIEYLNSQVD